MQRINWKVFASILLIIISIFLYGLHFFIFRDMHHIFLYLLGDIAFLPIEVVIVTYVIHKLIEEREKTERLSKMNMVIGEFYSEVGNSLISKFSSFNDESETINNLLSSLENIDEQGFRAVRNKIKNLKYNIDLKEADLSEIKNFIVSKRDFMLRLLENPNLLEHESFTELLRSVFHFLEEMEMRKSVQKLGNNDSKHLEGDIKRAYIFLVEEWLVFMFYLKLNYPYLFSLAVRTNPFNKNARVELD